MIPSLRCLAAVCTAVSALVVPSLASPPKSFLSKAASSPSGIVSLDTNGYNALVNGATSDRSDYSLSILLTALNTPGVDCAPCVAFEPEYEALSKAWKRKQGKSFSQGKAKHYFVEVEFSQGREVFMQLGLSHAPVLMYLPAGSPGNKGIQFDFNQHGFDGAAVADYLSKILDEDVGYRKPFPWKSVLTFTAGAGLVTVAFLFVIAKLNAYLDAQAGQPGGTNPLHWRRVTSWFLQLFSLAVITIMCSGYMWNNIRNAPYVGLKPGGKVEYFAGGFQNQLGVETQIVSVICECELCVEKRVASFFTDVMCPPTRRRNPRLFTHSAHRPRTGSARPNQTATGGVRVEFHLPGGRQCALCGVPY